MWKHIPSPAIGDVWWSLPFSFPQAYCLCYFLAGEQCCLPSHHLLSQWVQQCWQAIPHPPYHQAGESPSSRFRGEGAPPWLLCGWYWDGLPWTVCLGTPCAIQRQIKGFSCSFGKLRTSSINSMPAGYKVSRSVIGSREVRPLGFGFAAVPFRNCI